MCIEMLFFGPYIPTLIIKNGMKKLSMSTLHRLEKSVKMCFM